MKSKLFIYLPCFLFLSSVLGWTGAKAQDKSIEEVIASVPPPFPWTEVFTEGFHSIAGKVLVIEKFPYPQREMFRRVWIYLPPSYGKSEKRYPVLYMHDGQNVFNQATSYAGEWRVDESLEALAQENEEYETIVVAVDHAGEGRIREYNLFSTTLSREAYGREYAAFIVETLKPYIDQTFRTKKEREYTTVAGSSLGGYISLYLGMQYQDVFGAIGAFSTALWHDIGKLYNLIKATGKQREMKIYLDVGSYEGEFYIRKNQEMYNLFLELGYKEEQLRFVVDPTGEHNEASWSRRFPEAFKWWNSKP